MFKARARARAWPCDRRNGRCSPLYAGRYVLTAWLSGILTVALIIVSTVILTVMLTVVMYFCTPNVGCRTDRYDSRYMLTFRWGPLF
jgi:hypothetical protein